MSSLPFPTRFRNNIYWRHLYWISLRSSLFPIGSVFKLLIPFCSLFLLQYIFFKIAKILFESHGETVKFLRGPQICVLVHRSPLAQHMVFMIPGTGSWVYGTAKTKCRKFETNIPRKGISGSQSQFLHSSCVCERIIYSHHGSAFSAGGNMWTDPGTI